VSDNVIFFSTSAYYIGGHHGCDRTVVRFITTYAISAYHH